MQINSISDCDSKLPVQVLQLCIWYECVAEQRNDKFAVADAKLSLSYLFRLAAQRSFGKHWLQYSYFDIKLQFIEWTLN